MLFKEKTETKKIVNGLKWSSIQFVLDAFFRFSIRLILAKILAPEQFGLVGMCAVFIAIATAASELGMGAALIQKKENTEAERMYSTAFWTGIVWGVLLFLFMAFIVGPFATYFYNEPMLMQLIPALSLTILVKPINLIHTVILTRKMDFKRISKALNASSFIAGIISIMAAYLGLGVWSIILNTVLSGLISVPLLYLSTKWLPTFSWSKNYFKNIFGFGAYSTATNVFSSVTYNIDNLIIGKYLGASALGAYSLGFSLTEQLRQIISNVLNKVMYPVFGQNQYDKTKLRYYFLNIVYVNSILIYPLMGFLFLFADEIVSDFFGEKWNDAVVPIKILSIAMMIHLLVNSFTALIRGLGKPKLELKIIMFLTVVILIPGMIIGINLWGLFGATIAVLLNKIVLSSIGIITLYREIELRISSLFFAVRSAWIGLIISAGSVFFIRINIPSSNYLILSLLFFIVYLLVVFIMDRKKLTQLVKGLN